MFKMLKLLLGGKKSLIRSLDELEGPFAAIIKRAQDKASTIPPEKFAKEVIDEAQKKLCKWLDVDPIEIGL